ncbi:Na+/H+ antiporter NhaA [Tessaracoccus caeni]|uniref:Na+/H+ antiporter NhaA n=1 Tax=Tessaracoccus caeni TaxID=3031239 RepID=UPI0023DC7B7A|nr:Na+/H+ antiporter NhaA [Tessaracoccus caeni]MDF1489086.1 Na+/H+ antiporter NhaA [Tessaracoccus caeni]
MTQTKQTLLRKITGSETASGALLLAAAAIALIWANSPWHEAYTALSETTVGPHALHLDLSLAAWASDGLLALFFFVVGMELKHEFVAGSLRNPKEAAVPMIAAAGGVVVPALVFIAVILTTDPGAVHGWAIPGATDIAFALAVLAVFGRGLPRGLRTFLMTLAVVDDLIAIIIIAIFYTAAIQGLFLGLSLIVIALFGLVVRMRRVRWYLLLALAIVAWALLHSSGVHATVAGVLLGMTVPAVAIHGEQHSRTGSFNHTLHPLSSGVALPIFAFFAAGVTLVGGEGIASIFGQGVVLAVTAGLVIGKPLGVLGTTWVVTRFTRLRLPDAIGLRDLLPVGFLTGIGFTVALLVAELSFPDGHHTAGAKIAVLTASLLAAILGAILLRWDAHKARSADMNEDGIPDQDTGTI